MTLVQMVKPNAAFGGSNLLICYLALAASYMPFSVSCLPRSLDHMFPTNMVICLNTCQVTLDWMWPKMNPLDCSCQYFGHRDEEGACFL